jgi:hypothetical protein
MNKVFATVVVIAGNLATSSAHAGLGSLLAGAAHRAPVCALVKCAPIAQPGHSDIMQSVKYRHCMTARRSPRCADFASARPASDTRAHRRGADAATR